MYHTGVRSSIGKQLIPQADSPATVVNRNSPGRDTLVGPLGGARIIPLAIAAMLAAATAIECHAQASGIESFLSWGFSVAYGVVLWLWWMLVFEVMWRAGTRWTLVLRVSVPTLVLHMFVAIGVVTLHLGALQQATALIIRVGPEAVKAEYRGKI
jgi:hypothetical protein